MVFGQKIFNEGKEIRDYPIDIDYYDACKARVTLARRTDELEHQLNKEKSETNWYEKHSKLLDIDLDDELIKETSVDNQKLAKSKRQLQQLKNQLEQQLNKVIYPKNFSKNYLQTENLNRFTSINGNL
jgi:hypothetical protein